MKVVLEETWLSVIKETNRFTIMDKAKDLLFNTGASQQSVRHLKKQIKGFNLTELKKLSNLNYINKERKDQFRRFLFRYRRESAR